MAIPPDPGSTMGLIERELVTLRRNVEQELITGLREKLQKIVLDVVADTDPASAAKKRAKGGDEASAATNLRQNASAKEDLSGSIVTIQTLSPPQPPSTATDGLNEVACESPYASDGTEVTDMPADDFGGLPNCVNDSSLGELAELKGAKKKDAKGSELQRPNSSGSEPGNRGKVTQNTLMSEPSTAPSGRRSMISYVVDDLMLIGNDEALLEKKGFLWALDPQESWVARHVRNEYFDYVMGFVLVLNAFVIGLRVDWEASNLGAKPLPLYVWMDRLFCVIFSTELGLRIYTFRLPFYFTEGWQWAYFDTVVVAFQILEEIVIVAAGDSAINLGFLKMLKMGRLMRMVRMIRLLPELKSLVLIILASLSAFMWTCILLMLLMYALAVYMVMMTVDTLEQSLGQDSPSRALLQQYWGSVGSAGLSCYWCITGGQDWAVVIGPLVEETGSQLHNIVFCMFVAFATMVLMNLVTGVFVEGAQRLTKEDREKELLKMAHKVFRMVDDDNSEEIEKSEFEKHIKEGHLDGYLKAVDLDRNAADNLFEILDSDGSQTIAVNEFIEGCLRLRGLPRSADISQLLLESRKADKVARQTAESIQSMAGRIEAEMKKIRSELRSVAERPLSASSP